MPTYTYRRNLKREDWLKIIGVGAGAGFGVALAAGYLTGILLQRTLIEEPRLTPPAPPSPVLPTRPR